MRNLNGLPFVVDLENRINELEELLLSATLGLDKIKLTERTLALNLRLLRIVDPMNAKLNYRPDTNE